MCKSAIYTPTKIDLKVFKNAETCGRVGKCQLQFWTKIIDNKCWRFTIAGGNLYTSQKTCNNSWKKILLPSPFHRWGNRGPRGPRVCPDPGSWCRAEPGFAPGRVWVDSRSRWWTGRPGVLQFMGSRRVGHAWATELNWPDSNCSAWAPNCSALLLLGHSWGVNSHPFLQMQQDTMSSSCPVFQARDMEQRSPSWSLGLEELSHGAWPPATRLAPRAFAPPRQGRIPVKKTLKQKDPCQGRVSNAFLRILALTPSLTEWTKT